MLHAGREEVRGVLGHAGPGVGDPKCCPEELAALVEHVLLDDLIRP
jgi:hypothetical protein